MKNKTRKKMYNTYYRSKSSASEPHPAMTAVRNLGTVESSLCREALFTIKGIWECIKRNTNFMHLSANVLTFPSYKPHKFLLSSVCFRQ